MKVEVLTRRLFPVLFLLLLAPLATASQESISFDVSIRVVAAELPEELYPTWEGATPIVPGFLAVPGPLSQVVSELRTNYSQWGFSVVRSTDHRWEALATDRSGHCVRIDARTVIQAEVVRVQLAPCLRHRQESVSKAP